MKLKLFATRFNVNCFQIMMKRIRAHPRDRPSSRLVMQRGTYESSCRAVTRRQEGGGNYNPRYARYLLFCSFGDAFINQTPSPRRSSSAFFKPCSNIRHAATGGRTPLFFFYLRFWPFFCLTTCSLRLPHKCSKTI